MFYRLWIWIAYFLGIDPRGIFVYFDGRRHRHADPMVMARAIWSIPGFDPDVSRQLISSDVGATKLLGFEQIAVAVRDAWSISSAEDGGLTDLECFQLLARFDDYLGDLKKSGSPGPTLPHFTVPDVSQIEVTNPALDCG
jgi:hypothetical protein